VGSGGHRIHLLRCSAFRFEQGIEHAQCRAFAGAIWAEQARDLSVRRGEGNVLNGFYFAKDFDRPRTCIMFVTLGFLRKSSTTEVTEFTEIFKGFLRDLCVLRG